MIATPHIVIAGETFSYNLGDGVIAECLAFLARRLVPGIGTTLLDISARTAFGPADGPAARHIRRYGASARPLRNLNLLKWYLVRRRRCRQLWQPALAGAQQLVIGGGQLLMDNELDFPLKLSLLADMARSHRIPYHFLACGVGEHWSRLARRLLVPVLDQAEGIDVRDAISRERVFRHFGRASATISFDPAIWAAALYKHPPLAKPVVGLGIIGAREVVAYAGNGSPPIRDMLSFWLEVIAALQAAGHSVELFTNGSLSDDAMAARVVEALPAAGLATCNLAPRPRRPRDLAHLVASYHAIVAARLHANILAAAYRVPAVGLAWDAKVGAFYRHIGREGLCLDIRTCRPTELGSALADARSRPISLDELEYWKDQSLASMKTVLTRSPSGTGAPHLCE